MLNLEFGLNLGRPGALIPGLRVSELSKATHTPARYTGKYGHVLDEIYQEWSVSSGNHSGIGDNEVNSIVISGKFRIRDKVGRKSGEFSTVVTENTVPRPGRI